MMKDAQTKAFDEKNQALMTKTIAGRLHKARELCLFSTEQAAFLIGISEGELQKIESKRVVGRNPAPHWVIFKASLVYDVSIDFLYGSTNDWDLAEDARADRDFLSCLNTSYFLQFKHAEKVLSRQDGRLKAVEKCTGELPLVIQKISKTFNRFLELNPDFVDSLGSATLLRDIEEAGKSAHQATCLLIKHKSLPMERLYQPEPEHPAHKLKPQKIKEGNYD